MKLYDDLMTDDGKSLKRFMAFWSWIIIILTVFYGLVMSIIEKPIQESTLSLLNMTVPTIATIAISATIMSVIDKKYENKNRQNNDMNNDIVENNEQVETTNG